MAAQPEGAEPPAAPDDHGDRQDRGLEGLKLVGWGLLCALVWAALVLITLEISRSIDGADELTGELALLVFVIGQGAAGVTAWFVLPIWILRNRGQSALISWRRPTGPDVAWALSGLIAIYVVLFIYGAIVSAAGLESLEPESTIDQDQLYVHTSVMIALGILVIICAPIYEEAFARGFVVGGLSPYWGVIPALLASGAIFSGLHGDLGSLIPFAIAGIILGIVYLRTESLTAPSMAHCGFNIIGFSATLVQQLG